MGTDWFVLLVFIFPADGTFWSESLFCILDTEWVAVEQHEAGWLYHEHLLQTEQQGVTIDIGLRPIIDMELHAPIALESGTDPRVSPETVTPILPDKRSSEDPFSVNV